MGRWTYAAFGYSESLVPSITGHMRNEKGLECELAFKQGGLEWLVVAVPGWRGGLRCYCDPVRCPPRWFEACFEASDVE